MPFGILLLSNMVLIIRYKYKHMKVANNQASNQRSNSMTRTVIFITLLFIIMTLPGALTSTFFYLIVGIPNARLIPLVTTSLSSSYHAYSLVLLFFTNRKFAQQLRALFKNPQIPLKTTIHNNTI